MFCRFRASRHLWDMLPDWFFFYWRPDTHTHTYIRIKKSNKNSTFRIVDECVLIVFLQAHHIRKICINWQKTKSEKANALISVVNLCEPNEWCGLIRANGNELAIVISYCLSTLCMYVYIFFQLRSLSLFHCVSMSFWPSSNSVLVFVHRFRVAH